MNLLALILGVQNWLLILCVDLYLVTLQQSDINLNIGMRGTLVG